MSLLDTTSCSGYALVSKGAGVGQYYYCSWEYSSAEVCCAGMKLIRSNRTAQH